MHFMTDDRIIPASELIINEDGSVFHIHLTPEQLRDYVLDWTPSLKDHRYPPDTCVLSHGVGGYD